MINKQAFYDSIGEFAGIDGKVIHVEESVTADYEGCPTCGHGAGIDFDVDITYIDRDGNTRFKGIQGSLADFINGLD